eukprot:7579499-Pyramimonas_sp.AAC.2
MRRTHLRMVCSVATCHSTRTARALDTLSLGKPLASFSLHDVPRHASHATRICATRGGQEG